MAENRYTIRWYRVPIPREELKQLTARSDLLGGLQFFGYFAVIATTGTLGWWAWDATEAGAFPIWGLVLVIFLHGTLWAFLRNGFHEIVHGTVFKTRWLNTVVMHCVSFLGWHDPVNYKVSHTRHHLYTLHPPHDREVVLPIRMRLRHFLRQAVVDPWLFVSKLSGAVRKAAGGYQNEWQRDIFQDEGPEAQRRLRRWNAGFLAGHAAIIAAAVVTGWWQMIVLITLAPFYGGALEVLCNDTQHIGLMDNVDDFRLCCRTFTTNPVLRFLYFNMNYHTEHHMYAAIPCYRLHKVHTMIKHEMPPAPHGLIATWREIIAILKRQATDPEYQYRPPIPAARGSGEHGD